MIELQKDLIVTLEEKNYFVINIATYKNETYAYLVNVSEDDDYIYVKYLKESSSVEIIYDEELIKKIAPELVKGIN